MAPFRFGNRQLPKGRRGGDPVGKVAPGALTDLDRTPTVEHHGTPARRHEDGETEIPFEIGTSDESAEQSGERNLFTSRSPASSI